MVWEGRHREVPPYPDQLPQGPSVCDKIAASSDCSRPVNDYVHIEAADLRRPNARFTTERQGYQVLTPFGKLGYSRNRNIRARSRVGKRKWYVASGYSRRSKVETTFHRYKAILGSAMRARGLASQRVEVRLGCKILNTMTALGIPDGEMIG